MRRRGNLNEVASGTRFAAGEMDLQDIKRSRLAKHPGPSLRIKLTPARIER